MKYNMRRACPGCPFRRSRRFPLPRARMLQIVDNVHQGDCFPCHRSTGDPPDKWRACAGWLLYQLRNGQANATLMVMERAKLYRPRRLLPDPDVIVERGEIEEAPWFT